MRAAVARVCAAAKKIFVAHLYRSTEGPFQSPCERRRFWERDWRVQVERRRRLTMQSMMVAFRAAMTRPGEMQKPRPAAEQPQPPATNER